jgi:CoA:oxalate CoA-transferase
MSGPLDGVTVLDIGQLVQGPQAAAMLSDMGADVIKVELPQIGDLARWIFLSESDSRSAYYHACNRGKRSVTLDLRTEAGAGILKEMAKRVDVLVSNFKPGTLDEWGLGYDDLKTINPRLVWAAGSSFGSHGPDASREGADLAGQAVGGIISTIGHDGHPPAPIGVTIADHIASQNLVTGVLAALIHRNETGRGQRVEVSLLGGQIWAQAAEYSHYLLSGELPGRGQYGHPLLRGIYSIFETADGWIGVIGVPPASRDAFFVAMGQPELALDERFLGLLASPDDMKELVGKLSPVFRRRTTAEWCEALAEMGVRYAPVRNYREVVDDAGAWENGYFKSLEDHEGKEIIVVGTPIEMTATPLEPGSTAPGLGEHTDEVLREFGYSDEAIAGFREQGAI